MHGMRAHGGGLPWCKSLPCLHRWSQGTVPVLAYKGYLPRLGPHHSPHGQLPDLAASGCFLGQVLISSHDPLPCAASGARAAPFIPSSRELQLWPPASSILPSLTGSSQVLRVSCRFVSPPRCQIGSQRQLFCRQMRNPALQRGFFNHLTHLSFAIPASCF